MMYNSLVSPTIVSNTIEITMTALIPEASTVSIQLQSLSNPMEDVLGQNPTVHIEILNAV